MAFLEIFRETIEEIKEEEYWDESEKETEAEESAAGDTEE
jgi:hypothetical protein